MNDKSLIISPRYGGDGGESNTSISDNSNNQSSSNETSSTSNSNSTTKQVKEHKIGTTNDANVSIKEYNFSGVTLTENPTMSYFEAETQYISPTDAGTIAKKLSGIPEGLDVLPPSFYNTVSYPHREELRKQMNMDDIINVDYSPDTDDCGYFRIGCCEFKIPPEFINVSVKTGNTAIPTMRSSSSLMTKHSYADREITVKLVLNGMEQINGYKVDSPFGYPHYIDGLRALLGQFKFTPFVPVVNIFLNVYHNIHVVALSNITVQTIEGFPETLEVIMTLKEFNASAYTQIPNAHFDECVIWDLFNFYIQRNIRDKEIGLPMITTGHLTNKIVMKVLKPSVLEGKNETEDLLKDSNYEVAVDSEELNLHLTNITFATGNRMPKMQMSYYETPTYQFMGGTDTHFSMQFETTNQEAVAAIQSMNSNNLSLVRENKEKNSIGFIRVENELINLTGTKFVTINNISSSTVPGFPGFYTITVTGTSFDCGAKDREKFTAMRPFYKKSDNKKERMEGRKGTRDDLLTQTKKGLGNKVIQDACIESKLMETEMYPDLRLPKYSAIDWALGKIAKWRADNGLEALPFTKMPRPKTYIPGRGVSEVEYNGFVEPDFWLVYPYQSGDMVTPEMTEEDIVTHYKSITKELFGTPDGSLNFNTKSKKDISLDIINKLSLGTLNPVLSLMVSTPTLEKVIEPDYVPGYEPDQQLRIHWGNLNDRESDDDDELIDKLNSWVKVSVSGSGVGGSDGSQFTGTGEATDPTQNPKQVSKVTGNPFVDLLINRATSGCGYVYGASQRGDICTQDYINKKKALFGGDVGGWSEASKWIGKQVWDCSSFVCWGLIQIGLKPSNFKITSGAWGSSQGEQLPRNSSDLKVGDLCYGGGHIIVYIGNGKIVHASGHKKGCVIGDLSYWLNLKGDKCKKRCRITGLEEACKKFLEENPTFYLEDSTTVHSNSTGSEVSLPVQTFGLRENKAKELGVISLKTPSTSTNDNVIVENQGDYTSGDPILGVFGSDPMLVQLLDSSKREKSKKDRFVGSNADRWDDLIKKHSKTHNLDPNFIKTIIMIESGGNPNCYNGLPKNPCKGLMQLHQTYYPLPNPYDPESNIKKGCEVMYTYGSYKNPQVAFDKKKWIACFNRGPGNLKKQLAGTSPEPVETLNYYRKFDAFYGRLIQSGGKPGSTITALENGQVPPANWYKSGSSSALNSESTTTSLDVRVWFEKGTSDSITIDDSKLKNPNAGKAHSLVKTMLKAAKVGLLGPGTVLINSALEAIGNIIGNGILQTGKEKGYDRIEANGKLIENSYIGNKPKINREIVQSGNDIAVDNPALDFAPTVDSDSELPTQGEFGIGLIDNLSDGELNFDTEKVSNIEDFKNEKEIVERMFVDAKTYGQIGRLNRAFPSYIFLLIDEHQNWCDNKRFWSNYYLYQSVLEIDVHEAYDMPISTAKVTLSNSSWNLRKYRSKSITKQILGEDEVFDIFSNDSEYSLFDQFTYVAFGTILNEEIKDDMIEMRNTLYKELFVRQGFRVHIRMGYGSNPANYAPTFSGSITEVMDNGDMITLAAQSDGAELVANVVTDRTNAVNTDVGLPEEPSDIIAAMLCDRENEFLFQLTGGKTFKDNKHGICHFGFYSSGDGNPDFKISLWTDDDNGKNVFRRDALEYDVIKNIYKSSYVGEYIYQPNVLAFKDGEVNLRFFCYNRTPWDIMKMCEKMNPEFVCYPRPFGLEHRIFFGLPWWQHKFRYERDDANNQVYEMSKGFAQINTINSFQNIIENRMRIDTTDLVTNVIGIYTIGGDLASTPTIMSDSWIDRDKQVTKTIDTTSIQDFFGIPTIVEKLIEWSGGFDNGRSNAIRTCVSELIDSWRRTYSGEIIVLGAPDVRAWNYMYLNDMYVNMSGLCQVREVVHSMSGDSGYTSTIIPGLIACNSLKQSGGPCIFKSILQICRSLDAYTISAMVQVIALNAVGISAAAGKFATAVLKPKATQAVSFLKAKGANILTWFKNGKILANIKNVITIAKNAISKVPVVSKVLAGISKVITGAATIAAGSVAVVKGALIIAAVAVVGALINKLVTMISDTWRYDHVINVYPLIYDDRPWVGGATGQKHLYPQELPGEEE